MAQHGGPPPDLGSRCFGIAVARQIDEHQPCVEIEEVDLPGPTGGVRGSSECAAPGQRVEEARLADVRTPGEGDLRQVIAGKRRRFGSAGDEPGFAGEKAPSGLNKVGVYYPRRKYLRWDRSRLRHPCRCGQAAPARCMMVHCWPILSKLFHAQ